MPYSIICQVSRGLLALWLLSGCTGTSGASGSSATTVGGVPAFTRNTGGGVLPRKGWWP